MAARNHALDSLRGLAALAVALGHSNLAVTGLAAWAATWRDLPHLDGTALLGRLLYLVFPSDAAVTLFFVLSGHVLWRSFDRSLARQRGDAAPPALRFTRELPDYVAGRLYRLLPTVLVASIPVALLKGASVATLVENILLLRTDLLGVTWTLQVELVCSLALFVLHRLVRGRPGGALLALLALGSVAVFFRGWNFALFFPAFLLGALIDAMPRRLWRPATLWLGLLLLCCGNLFLGRSGAGRLAEMAGAVALLGSAGALNPAVLRRAPLVLLGRISYPFYLLHPLGAAIAGPVVAAAALTGPAERIALIAVLSISVALPLAWVAHLAVEQPAMDGRPRLRFGARSRAPASPAGEEQAQPARAETPRPASPRGGARLREAAGLEAASGSVSPT
ncbi:acyltransferase family protein [Roseomonas elaeocarpi]|uniref:Acyltransferase family protein n=1 Tax=Roseomonas elaeocarpi TaxID=907779 RepID=A0ABV6JUN4_9PROT